MSGAEMEEGELSDGGVDFNAPRTTPKQQGVRFAGFQANRGAFGGFDPDFMGGRDLPDLVRSSFDTDSLGLDRKSTEKMEARAKRFNLESKQSGNFNYDNIMRVYENLGIPADERDGTKDKLSRTFRLESLHIRGFSKMVAEDIYEYFKEFSPISYEWVNNSSANVIWALSTSSAKALLGLSRPIVFPEEEAEEMEDMEDMEVNERVVGEDGEEEKKSKKADVPKRPVLTLEQLEEKFATDNDDPIYADEIDGDVPPGKWRIGRPYKDSCRIFMRIAAVTDSDGITPSQEVDLRQRNQKLRMEGGVLSASRKRKLRDQVMFDREQFEEQERAKKYTGPVGKNPWGTIASSWTAKPKERDFADELALFAKQRGISNPVRTKAKFRLGPKDWDDPDKPEDEEETEDVDPIAASLHRAESPIGEPVSDEELRWQKKLKRPRMSMVADEVESRKSAKNRLFQGLKRRVANPSKVEFFEEEVEVRRETDDEDEHEPLLPISRRLTTSRPGDTTDLRLTIKARMDEEGEGDRMGKRMNERFPGKPGRGSVMDRLGGIDSGETRHIRRAREDSGDSLERDNGEDLRGELDGRHAANMLIQVANNSGDNEEEADGDAAEEMETNVVVKKEKDVKKDKKKVKKTPTKTKQRPTEVVIKKEKDDDERKTVRRKSSPVDSKKDVREKIRAAEKERQREKQRRDEGKSSGKSAKSSGELARRKKGEDSKVGVRSSGGKKKTVVSKSGRKGAVKIKKEKVTDDESSSSSDSDSSDSDDSDSSSDSDSSDSSSSDSSSSDSDSSSSTSSDSEDERSKKRSGGKRSAAKGSSKVPQRKKDSNKGALGARDRRTGRRDEIRDRMAKRPVGRDRDRDSNRDRDRKAAAGSSRSRRDSDRDRRREDGGGRKKASASSSSGKKSGGSGSGSKNDSGGGLRDKLKNYLKQAKERRAEKK